MGKLLSKDKGGFLDFWIVGRREDEDGDLVLNIWGQDEVDVVGRALVARW